MLKSRWQTAAWAGLGLGANNLRNADGYADFADIDGTGCDRQWLVRVSRRVVRGLEIVR
jgi:hypothetical protein